MSTDERRQAQGAGEGTAAAPQTEGGGSAERGGARHGGRRRARQAQRQQPRRQEATLNMDELRELTELFSEHGLTDFEFENADIRIRLSRNTNPAPVVGGAHLVQSAPLAPVAAMQGAQPVAVAPATQTPAAQQEQTSAEREDEDLHIITSPIVGTFYRAPAPTADPFVKVGSRVETDTVVCIIEAMKLMNEIQAETTGTVEKIYVENGQPVEYGQPLFGIKS